MYANSGVAPLSEHQIRRLIKGQGVSIKSGSKHSIPMSKEQMKKFSRATKAGRGMVITLDPYQQKMCGGGFEEMTRDTGRYLQPTFDAAQDRAIREIGRGRGRGFAEDMREKYKNKKFYDNDGNLIHVQKGSALKRGKGFFDDIGRAFDPQQNGVADTFNENLGRQIASELIHKGLPIAGSTLGGIGGTFLTGGPLGGLAGSYAGEKIGEELARETGRQTGYGMKRKGKGLMSDAFAMAKSQGKRVAKSAISKAKVRAKELVNQYLDLGEKEARDMIGEGLMSDALAMAKSKGKKVAKEAIGKAKMKAKELVSQYLDLGEQKAQELMGEGSFGGYKKKMGAGMKRRLRGKALLPA